MIERQKRLKKAYEYVRNSGKVHTITDFASAIQYSRTYISAAMNGEEKYLTDNLFKNICLTYPDVFNLDYLLRGEGELLCHSENTYPTPTHSTSGMVSESPTRPDIPAWADTLLQILSKQIATNETLLTELRQSIKDVNDLKKQLSDLLCQAKK